MTIIYVKSGATGGNGSENNPFGTINEAFQLGQPNPGDSIYLRGGDYILDGVGYRTTQVLNRSGTADNRITVRNYPGETVNIRGASNYPERVYDQYGPMMLIQASYLHIEGINFTYGNGVGITIYTGTSQRLRDISIVNVNISNQIMAGLNLYDTDNLIIRGCQFVDNCRANWVKDKNGQYPPNQVWSGCIMCTRIYGLIVEDCIMYGSGGEGLIAEGTAFSPPPYSKDITIRNNIFYNNWLTNIYAHGVHEGTNIIENNLFYQGDPVPTFTEDRQPKSAGWPGSKGVHIATTEQVSQPGGGSFNPAPVKYWTVRNNVLTNMFIGILLDNLSLVNGTLVQISDIDIYHNTINSCIYGIKNWGVVSNPYGGNVNIKNNLVNCDGDGQEAANGNFNTVEADYNLWRGSIPASLSGAHDVTSPPLLAEPDVQVNAGSFNPDTLKVLAGSPAIDAGTTAYAAAESTDFYGNLRDEKPDMGAHEFEVETIQAAFSASPLEGLAPLRVTFKDESTSTQPITSWFWDLGDGSVSIEKNPVHEYKQGTFSVSLRVSTGTIHDILTKQGFITVQPPEVNAPPRVIDGLVVFYRFDEGSGEVINDVSGIGRPLDLRITDPQKTSWLRPGLKITSPTVIATNGPAEKINEACRKTHQITLEVWLKPENLNQKGPARIVSISQNAYSRNITLGQGLWGTLPADLFDVRLRTTERSANGMPSFSSSAGSLDLDLQHIAFTRDSSGRARLFIDGIIVAEAIIPGDFSTWNPRFPLLIGNETTMEFPWVGEIYLMAMYNRALTDSEIRKNYDAGIPVQQLVSPLTVSLEQFKRFVVESNGTAFTATKTLAFGVQYPDQRCIVCPSNGSTSMTIYENINEVSSKYQSTGAKLRWLD